MPVSTRSSARRIQISDDEINGNNRGESHARNGEASHNRTTNVSTSSSSVGHGTSPDVKFVREISQEVALEERKQAAKSKGGYFDLKLDVDDDATASEALDNSGVVPEKIESKAKEDVNMKPRLVFLLVSFIILCIPSIWPLLLCPKDVVGTSPQDKANAILREAEKEASALSDQANKLLKERDEILLNAQEKAANILNAYKNCS
jgi:hypothetical protein